MTEKLFVYGTLRYRKVQLRVIGRSMRGELAELRGYERFKTTIGTGIYFAIRPKQGARVKGKVLKIETEDFKRLDVYETGYERRKVALSDETKAWTYVLCL